MASNGVDQIQALVLHGAKDLKFEERPKPVPAKGEVQIQVKATGLCGSDLHYYNHGRNGNFVLRAPLCLGHEASGILALVPDEAATSGLKVGDRVAMEVGLPCRLCNYCTAGRYNLCQSLRFKSSAKTFPHLDGTLQTVITHPADMCHKLPDNVSFEQGALVEPLAVSLHALRRSQNGNVLAVSGVSSITVADIDAPRLKIVEGMAGGRFHFKTFLIPKSAPPASTEEAFGNAEKLAKEIAASVGHSAGFDRVFECTGVPPCVQLGCYAAAPGGKLVLVGMGSSGMSLPTAAFALREVDVIGVFRYANCYPAAIALLASGQLDGVADALVTHRVKLQDGERAFSHLSQNPDMDISFPANPSEIKEIQEEIGFNRTLLESLDDDLVPDAEGRRTEINKTLESLEMRLKDLEADALTRHYPSLVDGHISPSPDRLPPPPFFGIPSRKRHQGYLDVEVPEAKSRRQSPSGAPTPASSTGTGSSSDVEFMGFRSLHQVDAVEDAPFSTAFDHQRQLEEDAEIAKRLQADIYRDNRPTGEPSSSSATPASWDAKIKKETTPSKFLPQMRTDSFPATQASYNAIVKDEISPFVPLHRHMQRQPHTYYRPTEATDYVYKPPEDVLHLNAVPGTRHNPYDLDAPLWHNNVTAPWHDNVTAHWHDNVTAHWHDNVTAPWHDKVTTPWHDKVTTPWRDNVVSQEQTDEHLKNLLKQIRPDEELTVDERSQIPDGLKISLMKHQAAGVAWMKRMEESSTRAGILADDMGLGKTVQTIALMLARPPPPQSRQPTLIVAPLALLRQWKEELAKFVAPSHRFNVLILHGPNRPTKWAVIKAYDVIITTYSTLATELKRRLVFQEKRKYDNHATPKGREEFPLLGDQTLFHRVVLDEAQNIKNKSTKSAIAACSLKATHRWCLTGTPMQNNTDEMFSLIKFCRIPPYNEYERFRRDIGQPLRGTNVREQARDRAMERLQALLKSIMLRRNKKSKIDGRPILQLPPKRSVEDRAHFDKDQLDFYRALEAKAQIQFNKYIRAGTVGRNYSNALVLLLRLRQACCHPHLITNSGDFALATGNIDNINFKKNAKALSWDVVARLKDVIELSEAIECPVCMDANDNPVIFACGHALCNDCLARLTDNALNDNGEGSRAACPHCRAAIDATKITNLISFLKVHWSDHMRLKDMKQADNEDEAESDSDDSDSDDSDDDSFDDVDNNGDLRNFIVADDEALDYDTDGSESNNKKQQHQGRKIWLQKSNNTSQSSSRSGSMNRRRKGKDKATDKPQRKTQTLAQLRKEALKSKSAKKKYLKKLTKSYIPSAKIEKTLSLLEEIREAGQDEKTIIFSSFTSFLDLLEVPLSTHPDFQVYTRYDGSMDRQAREEAVYRFRENHNCKVMLISLKAGNAGLNLTAANHVIILDPFWNPFVEYQAADRCYRIGQTKEVTIHRILIGEIGREYGKVVADGVDAADVDVADANENNFTVEDRIVKLQEKKRKLVDMALDESAGERIGRLGQRELGYLFGVNRLD
ncbi:hypothetical protein DV737_g4972, partial [Chaetothyriales sp. CBS 132003]